MENYLLAKIEGKMALDPKLARNVETETES